MASERCSIRQPNEAGLVFRGENSHYSAPQDNILSTEKVDFKEKSDISIPVEDSGIAFKPAETEQEINRHELQKNRKTKMIFSCKFCNRKYRDWTALKVHERSHTGGKAFTCKNCSKCFASHSALENHARIHFRHQTLKCDQCSLSFMSTLDLKNHKECHASSHEISSTTCVTCGRSFATVSDLNLHLQTVLTDETPFRCDVCPFANAVGISEHKKPHKFKMRHQRKVLRTNEEYQCSECPQSFTEAGHLEVHKLCHTFGKPFSCSLCKMPFRSSVNLLVHVKHHTELNLLSLDVKKETAEATSCTTVAAGCEKATNHPDGDFQLDVDCDNSWRFNCGVCETFVSSDLKVHIKTHMKIFEYLKMICSMEDQDSLGRPFKCNFCEKTFSVICELQKHRLEHKFSKCRLCKRSFSAPYDLAVHLEAHGGEMPLKCSKCDRSFVLESSLEAHEEGHKSQAVQTKTTFLCDKCPLVFSDSFQLLQHKNVHILYQCGECPLSFKVAADLAEHKRVHKKYDCKQCILSFKSADLLEQHEREHNVHQCSLCSVSFKDWSKLKNHVCTHELYKCNLCPFSSFIAAAFANHEEGHKQYKQYGDVTVKKKYECDHCPSYFEHATELVEHNIIHRKPRGKILECTECGKLFESRAGLSRHTKQHGEGIQKPFNKGKSVSLDKRPGHSGGRNCAAPAKDLAFEFVSVPKRCGDNEDSVGPVLIKKEQGDSTEDMIDKLPDHSVGRNCAAPSKDLAFEFVSLPKRCGDNEDSVDPVLIKKEQEDSTEDLIAKTEIEECEDFSQDAQTTCFMD